MKPCKCGSGQYREPKYDAQGIFLEYACDICWPQKMKKWRPEILTGYSQADVDEPIDPED